VNVVESFGLGVSYRGTWALRDCTLAVPEGHIVALVGSNGAGKTTLLHCAVDSLHQQPGGNRARRHWGRVARRA